MKKLGLGLLACAVVATADARIELFWSTTGLVNNGLRYSTDLTSFLPIVSATPVSELPFGTHDLYLWGRFIEDANMPAYTQVYGLDLRIQVSGAAGYAENVAYRHALLTSGPYRRWDGSLGIMLDGVMAAVTGRGVEFILPPDTNHDLYFPDSHEFLLGALHATSPADGTITVALDSDDGLGIAMRYIGGDDIPDPLVTPAVIAFVPEPAALLVLGALSFRRR